MTNLQPIKLLTNDTFVSRAETTLFCLYEITSDKVDNGVFICVLFLRFIVASGLRSLENRPFPHGEQSFVSTLGTIWDFYVKRFYGNYIIIGSNFLLFNISGFHFTYVLILLKFLLYYFNLLFILLRFINIQFYELITLYRNY